MANNIILKKSSVTAKVPLTSDLEYGELALNYADGKLYYKTATNNIQSFNAGSYTAGDGITLTGATFAVDSTVLRTTGTQTITGTKTLRSSLLYQSPDQSTTISSNMLNGGTLSFEGTSGQLFSISDSLTGSIFSVNDISGIPSIEVLDTGLVKLAEYSGNVLVGTTVDNSQKLQVAGTTALGTNLANYLTVTGAATATPVNITTAGSDANIGLTIATKGTGAVVIDTGTGAGQIDLKPGSSNVRFWDNNSTYYYELVTGDRTANYNITLPAGNVTLTAGTTVVTDATNQTIAGVKTFSGQITSTVAAGTAPLVIASTTRVANLNVATAGTADTSGTADILTTGRTVAITGDLTYTSGSFNGSANVTGTGTLASVGTAGTYTKVTTDAKGRVTSGTALAASDIPNLDAAKITSGTIDAARLPSYVDDVVEYANLAGFPATGDTGKLYVALDTNKVYRWSGSTYIFITSGAVDSVAGKTGVVTLVKGDVGLGSVDNTADSAKSVLEATRLTTTRTLWGQNFNGSANVTGNLTSVGDITGTGAVALTATAGTLTLAATGANVIRATINGSERLRIDSDGNVGIGISNPGALLEIQKSASGTLNGQVLIQRIRSNAGSNGIFLDTSSIRHTAGTDWTGVKFRIQHQVDATPKAFIDFNPSVAGQDLAFGTANAERMRIDASGNVGIGTGTPLNKLDVVYSASTTTLTGGAGTSTATGTRIVNTNTTLNSYSFIDLRSGNTSDVRLASVYKGANLADFVILNDIGNSSLEEQVRITSGGNMGVGTSTPAYKLEVNGSFAAITKSFLIDHPTKSGKKLVHGSLEGPEHGVYVRGKITGTVIELPEYWTKLVDADSITVQLTAIGRGQKLYVDDIRDNKIYIANDGVFAGEPSCFYFVQAERVDIEKLQVEV